MAIDIFNPEVSEVIKGIQGKLIMIYGTNSTGKTKNAVKSDKPLVAAFESGLNALPGVRNIKIDRWKDWTDFVKQLTQSKTKEQAKATYSTIIVDTADGMASHASNAVAAANSVSKISEGNRGYGLWKEYSEEVEKHLKLLTNAGYTVIFLAHEDTREFLAPGGQEKYPKIYPKGDKRVIDPICDLCDIIGYARIQPNDEEGNEVLSTLYLKGDPSFHARSRFDQIVPYIEEWSLDKLEKELIKAIELEEKVTGKKAIDYKVAEKKKEKKAVEKEKAKQPIDDIIEHIGNMLQYMNATEGNINNYKIIMSEVLGNDKFVASEATEAQREPLEMLRDALIEEGYDHEVEDTEDTEESTED